MIISPFWYDHISIFLGRQDKIIEGRLHKPPILIISMEIHIRVPYFTLAAGIIAWRYL
jgi:hypothetical protein